MRDNEIISIDIIKYAKALNNLIGVDSAYFNGDKDVDAIVEVITLAAKMENIINRQKREIERLQKLYELAVAEREANVKGFAESLNSIKSEAIKEFAEELCDGRVSNDPVVIAVRCAVKEMTEEMK